MERVNGYVAPVGEDSSPTGATYPEEYGTPVGEEYGTPVGKGC